MRNYEKEAAWAKQKYCRIYGAVDQEKGKKFKEKIKRENKTINQFLNEKIDEYLN